MYLSLKNERKIHIVKRAFFIGNKKYLSKISTLKVFQLLLNDFRATIIILSHIILLLSHKRGKKYCLINRIIVSLQYQKNKVDYSQTLKDKKRCESHIMVIGYLFALD